MPRSTHVHHAAKSASADLCTVSRHAAIKADPSAWAAETRRRAIWIVRSRHRAAQAKDLRDCRRCGSTLSRPTEMPGPLDKLAYAIARGAERLVDLILSLPSSATGNTDPAEWRRILDAEVSRDGGQR